MAIPNEVQKTRAVLKSKAADSEMRSTIPHKGKFGLSPRQAQLNHLWSFYTGNCYDARKLDWNGQEHLDQLEHEVVARSGFIPPGFMDGGQSASLPIKFRRPTAPYYLARVIVNRFTGLLFSERRHPKISIPEDPDTEQWVNAFLKATRFWSRWIAARRYGGAMGAVGMGFKFVKGRPVIEVHDPRWSSVEFSDPDTGEVSRFEKRYMFPKEVRNAEGEVEEQWFWYRRVITPEVDIIWPQVALDDGAEPAWESEKLVKTQHNLGFVPVVWVKNTDSQDEHDGVPDCQGIYDVVQSIDALQSQAFRGTIANLDPTLKIKTDGEQGEVRKGSDNALVMGQGDDASYLEITGAGINLALTLAKTLREQALEVSQCVLDTNFSGPARTEVEVKGNFSAMLEAADELREQYGEVGIKKLLQLVLRAARKLDRPVAQAQEDGTTRLVRQVIKLSGDPKLGPDEHEIELNWPPYFEPSVQDGEVAVRSATAAKNGGLIDNKTATKAVAPFFPIEDINAVAEAAAAEAAEADQQMRDAVMQGGGSFGGGPE